MPLKKYIRMSLVFLGAVSVATAQYSGGSGTAQEPYQIATAEDLITLGETPDDYDKHFVLTADIDLDPSLPGAKVFDKALTVAHSGPCPALEVPDAPHGGEVHPVAVCELPIFVDFGSGGDAGGHAASI